MFLKRKMNDSTNSYSDKILQIKEKIGEADAVVIGAGAGFSTSAGFVYDGERFEKYFNFCDQIIAINMNGTDFQDRNNGLI